MANLNVDADFPSLVGSPDGTERLPASKSGSRVRILLSDIRSWIAASLISKIGNQVIEGSLTVDSLAAAGAIEAESMDIAGAIAGGSVTATGAVAGASVAATGAVTGASVTATGAVAGASVTATGAVTGASAALTGAVTSTTMTATGAMAAGSVSTAGTVTATGAISGGSITTTGASSTATLTVSGATTSGGLLTASAGIDVTGAVTASGLFTGSSLIVTNASGTSRSISFRSGTSDRWVMLVNSLAETGANAGSNFSLTAYDDAGATLFSPITANRATGAVNLYSANITTGDFSVNGNIIFANNRHLRLRSYTVGTLPTVGVAGQCIYVSNDSAGATPAFSDGSNWRRMHDRTLVA